MTGRRIWTPEMEARLTELYAEHTAPHIAEVLGMSVQQVYSKAQNLKLRKTSEWIAERARRAMADPNHPGRKTMFRPGQESWNAGKKGLNLGGKETQFKPGQKTHSWRPIGSDRVTEEGYRQRKIADTGVTRRDYVAIHHLMWRMHGHGLVPPTHALCFRDGDKTNFDINNLELVPRAELMNRNTVHRLPPEAARAVQMLGALRRQINKREKAQHENHG